MSVIILHKTFLTISITCQLLLPLGCLFLRQRTRPFDVTPLKIRWPFRISIPRWSISAIRAKFFSLRKERLRVADLTTFRHITDIRIQPDIRSPVMISTTWDRDLSFLMHSEFAFGVNRKNICKLHLFLPKTICLINVKGVKYFE